MVLRFSIKSIFKLQFWLLAVLLTGLVFSGCATGTGPIPKGWSGVTVIDDTLFVGSRDGRIVAVNTANGTLVWSAQLKSPVSGSSGFGCATAPAAVAIYGPPLVIDDLIYVGGYIPVSSGGLGMVFAFDFGRNEPSWLYPKQGVLNGGVVGGLVLSQGKIYFGSSDGTVYALEAKGLFEARQFPITDKIWSTPAIDGDTLYIGSFDKKLYAIDTATGKGKWEKPYETKGAIVSPPVIDDGTVYFGSLDRYFYALNAADGSLKWKLESPAGNWFWAKPVVRDGTVYAANLDGKVYALDAESGQKQVEFDLGSPISAAPVLVDELLIVATEAGGVYSLDTVSKQQSQLVDLGEKVYASLAASGGKVYIHSNSDRLYEIDARSGAKRELNIR